MKQNIINFLFIVLFMMDASAQGRCPDEKINKIYDQCVFPYFRNLNDLIDLKDNFEKTDRFINLKKLFEDIPNRTVPQDFLSDDYNENHLKRLSFINYIIQIQNYWGGHSNRFEIPKPSQIYAAYFNGEYIVSFNKIITGTIKIKNEDINDAASSKWVEFTLNAALKIVDVRIAFGEPLDLDHDNIIDFYKERKTDFDNNKAGLLKFNGRPDSDCDGVEDLTDKFYNPGYVGPVTADGFPDQDNDDVPDKDDIDDKVPGLKECKGGLDRDSDGTCDYRDVCPDTYGRRRDGCERAPKPYILSLSAFYGAAIPLGVLGKSDPLTGTDYTWTNQAGFAGWSPFYFGLTLNAAPTRIGGLGVDAFYWKMPFDNELFGRLLNTNISRRVANFETANTSTSAYQGFCIVGKVALGYMQRSISIKVEPQFGLCFASRFKNSISTLFILRNADDVSQSVNLMPNDFPVYGFNLIFSKQLEWNDRHFGIEIRSGFLKGEMTPSPSKIDILDGETIEFGKFPFQMLSFSLGINYSFWEPLNNRQ